jgi:hypothetical protein
MGSNSSFHKLQFKLSGLPATVAPVDHADHAVLLGFSIKPFPKRFALKPFLKRLAGKHFFKKLVRLAGYLSGYLFIRTG